MPRRQRAQPEAALQASIVEFHRRAVPEGAAILFAVPNGERRDEVTGARLKALGVLAGAPDLILLLPAGRVRLLELKAPADPLARRKAGRPSSAQKAFAGAARALGHDYRILTSLESYVDLLDESGIPMRFRPITRLV